MAEKIKKFFERKKSDAKFKLAGRGHKLNESSSNVEGPSKRQHAKAHRSEPSDATRQAAEAALARLNSQKKDTAFNTSLAAIQAQVRRELEAEKKLEKQSSSLERKSEERDTDVEVSPNLAVQGVYYRCTLVSDEVLTKEEWKIKIKQFLYEQLEEERGLTACLMIHSCNYNKTKVSECVEVLCKYLDNILSNPDEVKFHKIRCSNVAFNEKQKNLENNGVSEDFWVFDVKNITDIQTLEFLKDAVRSEDRIDIELDRNVQVLSPAQAAKRVDLPQDFFTMTSEELKKEQQQRHSRLNFYYIYHFISMREKDEWREMKKYKYALIRVRFPDGLYLQGTFSVYEKFGAVLEFIQENLEHQIPFVVTSPTGHKFEEGDQESTLFALKLVPATILIFEWDPSIGEDIHNINSYLKPEIMMLVRYDRVFRCENLEYPVSCCIKK
ncbi:hypothetical protein RN001_000002 [Aquatica leii]|uniref:UBX domain-containing protein n=1 Tax=Aquatica leii TaxID=1421715 RepID=A0AAN7PLQ6_9COLE|nr:hypothetical protein RN001_000002 [Aquatica leii]